MQQSEITVSYHHYIDGLVQDCSISSANALEILQSYTKPSICYVICLSLLTYPSSPINIRTWFGHQPADMKHWPDSITHQHSTIGQNEILVIIISFFKSLCLYHCFWSMSVSLKNSRSQFQSMYFSLTTGPAHHDKILYETRQLFLWLHQSSLVWTVTILIEIGINQFDSVRWTSYLMGLVAT